MKIPKKLSTLRQQGGGARELFLQHEGSVSIKPTLRIGISMLRRRYIALELTIEVAMADIREVHALVRKTRGDRLTLLLHFENNWQEAFDMRGSNIVSVRTLNKRLPFEIEDRN